MVDDCVPNSHDEMPADAVERPPEPSNIAVCLSGGGHRASLFGLGALMYLVDAQKNGDVKSIASVSGGSITNGYVAQAVNFRTTDSADFEKKVAKPLASQIALRGTLFAAPLTKLYLLGLTVAVLSVIATVVLTPGPSWLAVLIFGVLLWPLSWLVALRGRVCASAFDNTLFHGKRLRGITTALDHIICATETRASQQFYFSGTFLYSWMFGHGVPADLKLAIAVQASAAFPGGFPPSRLPVEPHSFTGGPAQSRGPTSPPEQLVLADGGIYDNMGDQWARGFRSRAAHWDELGAKHAKPDQLVVVNATARDPWRPFKPWKFPFWPEIASLKRAADVMYINTTNLRRQEIVPSFDPLRPKAAQHLPGALVQITQSPYTVADFFAGQRDPSGATTARAEAAIAALGDTNRISWQELAKLNAAVPTTLRKLGAEVSARLMAQGYVVAMCNLYVIFGDHGAYPLLAVPNMDHFQDLIGED